MNYICQIDARIAMVIRANDEETAIREANLAFRRMMNHADYSSFQKDDIEIIHSYEEKK